MRYALWGVFGTLNFGNEATLHAVLDNLPRFDEAASYLIIAAQPKQATLEHGVEAVSIFDDRRIGLPAASKGTRFLRRLVQEIRDVARVRRVMRSLDVLLIAGTGILHETGEGVFGWPFQLFKWCAVAKRAGKRVIFLSVGADGLSGKRHQLSLRVRLRVEIGTRFLTRSLALAHYRSYRDPLSRKRVAAHLPSAATDPIAPDLAFSLISDIGRRVMPCSGRVIGVGLFAVEGEAAQEIYLTLMERLVVRLHERGCQVRLLIGDATYDPPLLEALSARLSRRLQDRVSAPRILDFRTLLQHLGDCEVLIGTRFHNLLLAMLIGTPVISVSHMAKNDLLMASMNLSGFCVPLPTADVEQILRLLDQLLERSAEVRTQMGTLCDRFARSLDDQYRSVIQLCRPVPICDARPGPAEASSVQESGAPPSTPKHH